MKSEYANKWKSVPIPDRMKHLELDRRGYPIPDNILRDENGTPHFIINSHITRERHIREGLCAICGLDLEDEIWLVGGPLSSLHPQGAFNDTSMHEDCVKYALQVCPFMAMRPYKRPDPEKVISRAVLDGTIYVDPTQIPGQPKITVLISARGFGLTPEGYLKPWTPYKKIEIWQGGRELNPNDPRDALIIQLSETRIDVFQALRKYLSEK